MDKIENIFKLMDDDYKNIDDENEIYYKYNKYDKFYYKYIIFPTLNQLFDKYKYNIEMINYETINNLDTSSNYIIDFRGDTIGEIIINYSDSYSEETDIDAWVGSIRDYPLNQLLCLNVNIPSWNKYSNKYYTEKKIVERLYKILMYKYE